MKLSLYKKLMCLLLTVILTLGILSGCDGMRESESQSPDLIDPTGSEETTTQEDDTDDETDSMIPLYYKSSGVPIYGPLFENYATNPYDQDSFVQGDTFTTYEDENYTSVIGIDVSGYQGDIDWNAVAESGVTFAMIRIGGRGYTEGGIYEDSAFEANIKGALDAGIEVGVYFYSQAISADEAVEEADQILEWIDGYNITYPIALDWEILEDIDEARTNQVTPEVLNELVKAFCSRIEQAGYDSIVYASPRLIWRGLDLNEVSDVNLWLVSYSSVPTFYYDFEMWQYTREGSVPGIDGDVDLNIGFVKKTEG